MTQERMPYEVRLLHMFSNWITEHCSLLEVMGYMSAHQEFLSTVKTTEWFIPVGTDLLHHVMNNWPADKGGNPMHERIASAMCIRLFMGYAERRDQEAEAHNKALEAQEPAEEKEVPEPVESLEDPSKFESVCFVKLTESGTVLFIPTRLMPELLQDMEYTIMSQTQGTEMTQDGLEHLKGLIAKAKGQQNSTPAASVVV